MSYIPRKRALQDHQVDDSGDVIIHDQTSGQLVVLNAVGAATLSLSDGHRSLDEIVDVLAEVFQEASRADIERDVRAFLDELARRQLVDLLERS